MTEQTFSTYSHMELINEVEWGHRGIEMQYPRFKIEYIKIAILKNEFKYFIKTDWHFNVKNFSNTTDNNTFLLD